MHCSSKILASDTCYCLRQLDLIFQTKGKLEIPPTEGNLRGRGGEQGIKGLANGTYEKQNVHRLRSRYSFPLSLWLYVSSMYEWLPDTFNLLACYRHTFQALKLPRGLRDALGSSGSRKEGLVPGRREAAKGHAIVGVRVQVLIKKETGCPCQCPVLQQRRRTQVCIFSIKLGATNPALPTTPENSKPRPPGGAVVKFPLAKDTQSGRAVPSSQLCRPLPTHH